jgi:hypothetical protein
VALTYDPIEVGRAHSFSEWYSLHILLLYAEEADSCILAGRRAVYTKSTYV